MNKKIVTSKNKDNVRGIYMSIDKSTTATGGKLFQVINENSDIDISCSPYYFLFHFIVNSGTVLFLLLHNINI